MSSKKKFKTKKRLEMGQQLQLNFEPSATWNGKRQGKRERERKTIRKRNKRWSLRHEGLHRGDLAAQFLQERQRNFQAFIEEMTDDERKELLLKAGEKHPSFFLQITDGHHAPYGDFHPQPTDQTPSWCSCLRCRDMPTQAERICCGRPPNQCQSQLPD